MTDDDKAEATRKATDMAKRGDFGGVTPPAQECEIEVTKVEDMHQEIGHKVQTG